MRGLQSLDGGLNCLAKLHNLGCEFSVADINKNPDVP